MNMWFIFGLFRFRSHEDDLPGFLEVARSQFYKQLVKKGTLSFTIKFENLSGSLIQFFIQILKKKIYIYIFFFYFYAIKHGL